MTSAGQFFCARRRQQSSTVQSPVRQILPPCVKACECIVTKCWCVFGCVCVCVCGPSEGTLDPTDTAGGGEQQGERVYIYISVCIYVCVCV